MNPQRYIRDEGGSVSAKADEYLRSIGLNRSTPFMRLARGIVVSTAHRGPATPDVRRGGLHDHDVKWRRTFDWDIVGVGRNMETVNGLLKAVNIEIEESKKILQKLANEIIATNQIVEPLLLDEVKRLRSSRMTLVSEVHESLQALKDVRKFFLESDYELEMGRLERFVRVCKEIRELKDSGVFDAVCDAAIKLALREEGAK